MRAVAATVLILSLAAQVSCAASEAEKKQYLALSPESRDLFAKYRQFLTEHQQQEFLAAPGDADRQSMIRDLHIEERVARYPQFVQQAIWSRTPVVGMDKSALLLSLGKPNSVDRQDFDPDTHLVPTERWTYRRGELVDQSYDITIVNGEVSEVKEPNLK